MSLEETPFWTMTHNEQARAIELDWKSATADMTADDFKEALEHLAGHIRDQSATGTLIDVRAFGFKMTPDLDVWRTANIVPAYNDGGLKRFAYLLPTGVSYQSGERGAGETFTTDYFHDRELARSWLAEA